MGEVVQLPKCNVQHGRTERRLWNAWSGAPDEMPGNFCHETVYFELNRHGEGQSPYNWNWTNRKVQRRFAQVNRDFRNFNELCRVS